MPQTHPLWRHWKKIAEAGKNIFLQASRSGNAEFNYIPALDESSAWINALADLMN